MFIVACSVHSGYLSPPDRLAWTGSWWLILLSGVASLVDFFGDKVPVLDHALHAFHTLLAPVVGAVSAASGSHGDPAIAVLLAVGGAGNALFLHTARSGLRAASSLTTAGIANPVISIVEDIVVVLFIIVAIAAPAITAIIVLAGTIWLVRKGKRVVSRRQVVAA
jgi:hypothetical protein